MSGCRRRSRDAQLQKIPYMLVVGEREAAEGKVAVRLRSGKDLGAMPLESFISRIKNERGQIRVDVVGNSPFDQAGVKTAYLRC